MRPKTTGLCDKIKPPRMGTSVIVSSLAINMLGLALPLVVLQVFDRVIPFESHATLTLLFIGLCVTTALDFFLKWARIVVMGHQGEQFELSLGDHFMDRSLNAEPSAYDASSTGVHLERLNAFAQLRDYYSGQGRLFSIDVPFTAIFIVMIGLIGGWLVLVPLASLVLLYLFKTILQRAQGPIFEKRKVLDGRRYSFLIECLSQILTVKADTMEPQLLRRYELLQKQSVDISQSLIHVSGFSQSFGALFSQAAVAAMGLLGGYLVIIGQIGIAELAACMLLNGRTVQPLLKMLGHWAQTESIDAAQAKVDEISALQQRNASAEFVHTLEGRLRFDGVSAGRDDQENLIFSDVTLDVKPGEALSVVGEAGSGQATFMRLILGEQQPRSGEIYIDERPVAEFSATRGHRGIVYVDETPAIFSGSILENISCFGEGEAIARSLSISAELGLEKKVHHMPMGYSTPMGQVGQVASSLALLQTIALVRALALEPRILLINDATSAMDERAVARLAQFLQAIKGKTTLVMATPRQQLLSLAGQSIMLVDSTADSLLLWDHDAEDDAATAAALATRSA
ncbi:ABC transporter transmembrane domain-containing protein [Roseobacter sp.]|uniref:ABC transporter transmembrane domain-containing protein n=1 Tax=Roseobacter sp. TaxID=1907202 RepID=UPI0029676EF8|nr:ABC transporter transmembrane domain-containing protein [Roseobacter sp.]MDW3180760.1 ABC transporter transmembrane domain-containing protein [Roseobacter sp.]